MNIKKNTPDKKKKLSSHQSVENKEDEQGNLGLDADHSSDTPYHYLDNDNDRISGNPDGETDDNNDNGSLGHSPLLEK
ncbi:hypothetical protein [Pedobacter immunditicola]|uniref:hypothetical protein n=1 Tax=Pedobacter immunditicola TaxID=3133440 RepID=UPI00309AC12A